MVDLLNPKWVKDSFDSVFYELVKMNPAQFWPVTVGSSRRDEDKIAPESLLVTSVHLEYPKNDLDHCITKGMASCLHYCGAVQPPLELSRLGNTFMHLPKPTAELLLEETMKKIVPCIGTCVVMHKRIRQKRRGKNKVGISMDELINNKTPFPTLVVPCGVDGSLNHAVVVVDDLIFDSTQEHPLKLSRESLDWICGGDGISSLNCVLRWNRSHASNEKWQHQTGKN